MVLVHSYSYEEDTPTLVEVKREIDNIVGLPEIKSHLEAIVDKVTVAEKNTINGLRFVPPKPFHMVFIGNCGTGKSTVARILGKLFYLAGTLSSYEVTEVQGLNKKLKNAKGGVLLVDVEDQEPSAKTLKEIMSIMDEEETSVIFAGSQASLNLCMKSNKDLSKRFSTRLEFDDFTCQELARIIKSKVMDVNEDSLMHDFELDESCSIENIAEIIAEVTSDELLSSMNAHLVDQILHEAKTCFEERVGSDSEERAISLRDLGIGIMNTAQIYKKLLCL